jgi:hypothetical protein
VIRWSQSMGPADFLFSSLGSSIEVATFAMGTG